MVIHNTCQAAIQSCLNTKTFAIARLYNNEKTMGIHIHDCCEIYYSISGGKQFLVDNRVYEVEPGDIFFINQFESHYLSEFDQSTHMRVVISVSSEYLKRHSTEQTNLNYCFTYRNSTVGHKLSTTERERKRFMYYIDKLSEDKGFGQDVLDRAIFLEMMTFLNGIFMACCKNKSDSFKDETCNMFSSHNSKINEILDYINQHLADDLSIPTLANQFYLSTSYLHKIFKATTGTTINRYITAKRISWAKVLLTEGHSMAETSSLCGFRDYGTFLKAFTKIVGISPRQYASISRN